MNNSSNKYPFYREQTNTLRYLLIFMTLIASHLFITSASAQVCYSDAKTAYKHLIQSEQRQASLNQSMIDGAWVNINTASEAELTTLNGIGPVKAQEIILYRDTFGKFKNVDDLTEVHGIGPVTVEKNRQRLRVD